jgi:O-antigen/teichoic acid export membrane protein
MPELGGLASKRRVVEFDEKFRKITRAMSFVSVLGYAFFWFFAYYIIQDDWRYSSRLLTMLPITILILHRLANLIVSSLALYMRAHKEEPMMKTSVVAALLTSIATVGFGYQFGSFGVALGLLAVTVFWTVPSTINTFIKFNRARRLD